jgi:MFS transporter, YNFM family, putative membrane transport protein
MSYVMMTESAPPMMARHRTQETLRTVVTGLIGFLTLVDLFATQAILPSLAKAYGVTPSAMGFAVNASTMGMAAAGLLVGLASRHLPRRRGIWMSLALLAIPTALLSIAPDLETFTVLRIVQGVFMAAAFTLTMTYLAEHCTMAATARALAAYVTGVVASNLIGRLISASVADMLGLAVNFYLFAALNLIGAAVVLVSLSRVDPMPGGGPTRSPVAAWVGHLRDPSLRASFAIGFIILFAFIGTFTYVNFVLVRPPLSVTPMTLGLIYLVFAPSMVTTPLAGRAVERIGAPAAFRAAIVAAAAGLPLLLVGSLPWVLAGMTLVAAGTFFAQAIATGYVGRAAMTDRAAASGLYLSSYYFGGLVGAALLGQVFDRLGWPSCVIAIGVALTLAATLSAFLRGKAQTG